MKPRLIDLKEFEEITQSAWANLARERGLYDKWLSGVTLIPGCTCSLRVQKQVLAANDTSLHWCTCPTTRVEVTK